MALSFLLLLFSLVHLPLVHLPLVHLLLVHLLLVHLLLLLLLVEGERPGVGALHLLQGVKPDPQPHCPFLRLPVSSVPVAVDVSGLPPMLVVAFRGGRKMVAVFAFLDKSWHVASAPGRLKAVTAPFCRLFVGALVVRCVQTHERLFVDTLVMVRCVQTHERGSISRLHLCKTNRYSTIKSIGKY